MDQSVSYEQMEKKEEARGKHPRFNMADYYSHAKELIPVTCQYSFVQ
jgi:hypothetical protein